jgi:hypothetical protein
MLGFRAALRHLLYLGGNAHSAASNGRSRMKINQQEKKSAKFFLFILRLFRFFAVDYRKR